MKIKQEMIPSLYAMRNVPCLQHSSTVKVKELKDTCLEMQMSNQFLTISTNFLLLFKLADIRWRIQKFKYSSKCILQNQSPCRKFVSSYLFLAAPARLLPWERGKSEDFWSLLSRAEAQSHLYVTAMQSFLFLQPVTCNREENSFSFSL